MFSSTPDDDGTLIGHSGCTSTSRCANASGTRFQGVTSTRSGCLSFNCASGPIARE